MIEPMTEEQRDYLKDRHVVASMSGGKDSTALSLWLTENEIEHSRVFMNTGWEADVTLGYIRGELTQAVGPILELSPKRDMVDLILHKGMFPSRLRRFCTTELKVKPIIKYLEAQLDLGVDPVNAVGVRAGESKARSQLGEWEWNKDFPAETWRPLLRWTEQDVIDMIRRYDVRPNPLYLEGASRVGCWPCIFSRKSELRFIAQHDPDRIDLIELIEGKVALAAQARAVAKGTTLENNPTFFQSRSGNGACIPIRAMVDWSKTARGGRQYDMFNSEPEGCAKWGMCDSNANDVDDEE